MNITHAMDLDRNTRAVLLNYPQRLIKAWAEFRGVDLGARMVDVQHTMSQLWCDYLELYQEARADRRLGGALRRTRADYVAELNLFVAQAKTERLAKNRNAIRTTGEDLRPVTAWVRYVTGGEDPTTVGVVAQFCWQVKCKFLGVGPRPIADPIMPIFVGPGGGGKTMSIRHLISPLAAEGYAWINASFKQVCDNREWFRYRGSYVVFVDELSGATESPITTIKMLISAEEVDHRVLGSHDLSVIPMNSTFIGASNDSVAYQLVDTSGVQRRFYEIPCLPKIDWAGMTRDLDMLSLWRGIDETRPSYLSSPGIKAAVFAKQREGTLENYFLDYVTWRQLGASADVDGWAKIRAKDLYADYCAFVSDQDRSARTLPQNVFLRDLYTKVGIGKSIERTKHTQTTWCLIPRSCAITSAVASGDVVDIGHAADAVSGQNK